MDGGAKVFTEDEHGRLIPMRLGAPQSEDDLQSLIERFPEVLAEEEGELLLIKREHGIPDAPSSSDRWSLDHLFISKTAVPVLVEVKRASDTRIRREVIGQILDYAANGVAYWPPGGLQTAFIETCAGRSEDPDVTLSEFLKGEDPEQFWAQAQSNLEAGRLKLVVAADQIPAELARVVEFLNDQMRAEVRAVELRYYVSAEGRRTLVPRMIGETERTKATKSAAIGATPRLPRLSVPEWLERNIQSLGAAYLEGVNRHMQIVERLGGEIIVASTQGSLPARFTAEEGKYVYPLHVERNGRITISFGWTWQRPALQNETIRKRLYDTIADVVGGLSTRNLRGHPSFPATALCDSAVAVAYEKAVSEYIALTRRDGGDTEASELP